MIDREGRGTTKRRMRCKRDKWIENLKYPWKRMLEEDGDTVFLALGYFIFQVSVICIKIGDSRRY